MTIANEDGAGDFAVYRCGEADRAGTEAESAGSEIAARNLSIGEQQLGRKKLKHNTADYTPRP